MNRRDALKALASLAGATGLTVTPVTAQEVAGVELVLLKSSRVLDDDEVDQLKNLWIRAVEGTALASTRTVVLDSGLKVEFVRTKR